MPKHKFKIGERLFLARSIGLSVSGGAYVILKDYRSTTANLNIK
jgi:hypothetical protein